MSPICRYHNMTAFRHLLSAKTVDLPFVTKQHSETISPFRLSCKMHSEQEMHTEKITPLVRYFDTKNLFSSKIKSTLSFTSNYCLISVNLERSQLPVATSQRNLQHAELDLACEQCSLSSARSELMHTDSADL